MAGLYTDWESGYSLRAPQSYLMESITIVRDRDDSYWSAHVDGSGHTVMDSLFYGVDHGSSVVTNVRVDGNPLTSGNVCWQVNDNSSVCNRFADPQLADDNYAGVGTGFADFDFTVQNLSVAGIGSSITSVSVLLGE
jgi:hypothetical protein